MSAERDRWDELLARLSDGSAVDWDAARAGQVDPDSLGRIEALRDVARIAEFSRSAQRAALDEPPPAARRWGRFVLLERTGEGASSEVWRAWDPQLSRELAIKMLRDETSGPAPGGLLAEGRALARVRHPNVVAGHGLVDQTGDSEAANESGAADQGKGEAWSCGDAADPVSQARRSAGADTSDAE